MENVSRDDGRIHVTIDGCLSKPHKRCAEVVSATGRARRGVTRPTQMKVTPVKESDHLLATLRRDWFLIEDPFRDVVVRTDTSNAAVDDVFTLSDEVGI